MKNTLLLLLLITANAKAQNPFVKEENILQQVIIKYNPNANYTNQLLTALAEGNGKPLSNTQFICTLDQKIITGTREPLQHSSIVSEEINISGNIFYKGFDMYDWLFPTAVQYTLKTWNGNSLLSSVPFNSVKVENHKPEKKEAAFDDSLGQVTRHTIENFSLNYTLQNITTFKEHVNLINQYYDDAAKLSTSINLLQTINPNDIDHFSIQQKMFADASRIVSDIENKNYNHQLPLQEYDPSKMLNNLSLYHSQAANIQHDLDLVFSTLYLAYYDRGMDLLVHGKIPGAENYFRQSLAMRPDFAPALLQLALIDFRNNYLNEAIAKADDIIYRFDPDPDTRRLTYQMLSDIYESRLDKAAAQINDHEYHKAMEQYTLAKSICERYSNVRCSDELFKGIRVAKNGIYNDYLDAANDFLAKKRFDKAEQAASEAISYQRENSNDITDDSEARKILKEISRQRYLSKVEEGKLALNNKQYETALNAFNDATEMEINNGFTANTELPSLKTTAARPVIAMKLNAGDSLVKVNQLPAARNIIRTVADMQAKYALGNEKTISKRLEELRKKIFSQQCENAQRDFDDAYVHAKDALTRLEYVRADDYFTSAEKVTEENRDCAINTGKITEEHGAIIPPATYLKMMAKMNSAQQDGNYYEAQSTYEEAGNYFAANNVSSFIFLHESFYDYLQHKANNGFLYYALDYYTNSNELDKALNISRLLFNRHYDNKQLNGSLYQLGIKFGRKDKLDHPGEKYHKDYVQEYVNGDKKMKSFEKGYKMGWKEKN